MVRIYMSMTELLIVILKDLDKNKDDDFNRIRTRYGLGYSWRE